MSERMIIWLRLICILYLILFLPKIISVYNDSSARLQQKKQQVLLGIERLVSEKSFSDSIKPLRLGLVLDRYSYDQAGVSTDLALMRHGFMVNKLTRLPDLSVGGLSMEHFFKDIDAVLIDIQDHGLRTHPNSSTLFTLMKYAAQSRAKVIVTDRINPLGNIIEGPVDIVPLRHGMTIGELAGYYNDHVFARKVDLTVIPLRSWKRDQPLEGVLDVGGLLQHIYQDSMLECLSHLDPLKVLKEGDSYRAVVFPQGEELSVWETNYFKELCNTLGFKVADYAYWNKDQKRLFKGVRLGINVHASEFSTLNSVLTLMRFLKTRKSISLTSTQEFEHMVGGKEVRLFLEGRLSFTKFKKGIEKNVEKFYAKSKDYFLYEPFPQIKPLQLVKNS